MKNNIKEVFFEKEQAKHTKAKLDILQEYVIPWMRKVVLNKYAGTEIKYQGEDLIIVKQSDILAIVE